MKVANLTFTYLLTHTVLEKLVWMSVVKLNLIHIMQQRTFKFYFRVLRSENPVYYDDQLCGTFWH